MFLKYRPEIDGLRSIAIIAVILYHAEIIFNGIKLFKGGFIGVDIFFVISGYLITSIILHEMKEGKFSFARFYERRARRILPALFTVIFVSIPFSWMYMLPKAVKEYAGSVLTTLISTSNIWFWKEDSYWAEPSALKPFLHTWSLSVEGQFYLIFPIILLLLWKFLRNYITPVLTLIFLLSLQFAHFGSTHFPEATFFLLPTRGWELLAGSILAKLELEKGRLSHPFLDNIMPAIGLFLICNAIIFFNDKMPHPSYVTILPILGTMLIIWFCKKGELISDILGSRPFVAVGLISYSLYLWHQPIFVFARMKNMMLLNHQKVSLIVLSIILAILTYFIIEKPIRNAKKVSLKILTIFLSTFAIVLILPLGYAFKNNGLWGRFKDWQLKALGVDEISLDPAQNYVVSGYNLYAEKEFSLNENKKRLLIIEDSLSQDFYNIFKEAKLLENVDISTHYIGYVCLNVPESFDWSSHLTPTEKATCDATTRIGNEKLSKRLSQADYIIVASYWDKISASELHNLYSEIIKYTEAKVTIVGHKKFYAPTTEEILSYNNTDVFKKPENKNFFNILKIIREISFPNDIYLDLYKIIYENSNNKYPIFTPEGYLISYDGNHLTKQGAIYIGNLLTQNKKFMELWNSVFKTN